MKKIIRITGLFIIVTLVFSTICLAGTPNEEEFIIAPSSSQSSMDYGEVICVFAKYDSNGQIEKLTKHFYRRVENNSIVVEVIDYYDGRADKILTLPLAQNKAYLKTDNGKKLVLELLDKFGVLKVYEYIAE